MRPAETDGAIRIGLLTVKTGPLASGGIDMERALAMYLKERNNELAGRKAEPIVADTAGVGATARTRTQERVERDNVHHLIGPLAAFEALAVDDCIRQTKTPTLFRCGGRGHDARVYSLIADATGDMDRRCNRTSCDSQA